MIRCKIHRTYRNVVAISDEFLLGKTFEEGKFVLFVKESFFGGDVYTKDEVIEIIKDQLKEDATFNVIGEESVAMMTELFNLNSEAIKKIGGVPYILLLL